MKKAVTPANRYPICLLDRGISTALAGMTALLLGVQTVGRKNVRPHQPLTLLEKDFLGENGIDIENSSTK